MQETWQVFVKVSVVVKVLLLVQVLVSVVGRDVSMANIGNLVHAFQVQLTDVVKEVTSLRQENRQLKEMVENLGERGEVKNVSEWWKIWVKGVRRGRGVNVVL